MPVPENMPKHAQEIFERVMESLKGKKNPRTGQDYTDEERGKIAWSAVKEKYKKIGESWEAKEEELEPVISEILEFKSEDGKYYFKGYLSTFDIDLVNDLVTKECMSDMLNQINTGLSGFARFTKGSADHDVYHAKDQQRIPLSRLTKGVLDNKGLYVEGMFNTEHPDFKAAWNQVQGGFLDGLSIEYYPTDFTFKEQNGKKVRVLNKVLLKGYGHTPRPANPFCNLTDFFVKSLIGEEMKPSVITDAVAGIKTLTTGSASMETGTTYSDTSESIPVLVPTVVDKKKKIIEHLQKDSTTWMKLSEEARKEADDDLELLNSFKEETQGKETEENKECGPEKMESEKVKEEEKKEEVKSELPKEPQPTPQKEEVKAEAKAEVKTEVKAEPKENLEEQITRIVKDQLKSLSVPEKKPLSDTSDKFEEKKSEPETVTSLVTKGLGLR